MKEIASLGAGLLLASLVLAGCAADGGQEPPTEPLIGTYWKLAQLDGKDVVVGDNEREPHLVFDRHHRLMGSTGCNRLTAGFETRDEAITLSSLASTRMACAAALMTQEQRWMESLGRVARYEIVGDRLILEDDESNPLAELTANALY
ncbi:META domain-containing protein [Salinicola rhizosphaerae]|uniref:DUF306 domain-containing protein n=1 Tax=Salinicola rhizosphaerae TaxID=1443141 RepID=A0ABQ3ECT9_9GAMM|nr:META domain-containing protein [Salinicola rhizosphaerae]GHB32320.1 hypothetical protein GCM10009038_33880 [Salinicola rhizosphaerae]